METIASIPSSTAHRSQRRGKKRRNKQKGEHVLLVLLLVGFFFDECPKLTNFLKTWRFWQCSNKLNSRTSCLETCNFYYYFFVFSLKNLFPMCAFTSCSNCVQQEFTSLGFSFNVSLQQSCLFNLDQSKICCTSFSLCMCFWQRFCFNSWVNDRIIIFYFLSPIFSPEWDFIGIFCSIMSLTSLCLACFHSVWTFRRSIFISANNQEKDMLISTLSKAISKLSV